MAALALGAATAALLADTLTPWQVGDVFAGVGSAADSLGTYKTVDATGHVKLDPLGAAVPDLNTGTSWTTNCFVEPDPTPGDLWTTSWTDMTLGHFSGANHSLVESFPFNAPQAIAIPQPGGSTDYIPLPSALAALPRAAGVTPLPTDAIGSVTAIAPFAPAIDNGNRSAVIAPMPAIQAINSLIFATNGPYAGQMYIGTGVPPDNGLGRGHAYLLRVAYDSTAGTPANPTGAKLTLTGWWNLDAGSIANRQPERDALIAAGDPGDAAELVDGSSNGAGGVDNIDLSSDQQTIFYTSQDPYIRRVNVATGVAGAPIALQQQTGTDPITQQPIWSIVADARALGIRALPGKVDASGTLNPTAAGDGSAGFLVAVAGGFVYRVDRNGRVLYRYAVAGRPAALALAPDAQYFWTATTQDDPFVPQPGGGFIYRFHVSSGVGTGPFSPYGPPFAAGVSAQNHAVNGLCVKREYFAGATSLDQQKACFAMNPDGSPQLDATGAPIPDYCRTPALCSPFARGVALSPSGVPLGPTDPANAACYPPGAHKPAFADQHSHEGDTISIDLTAGNPDLVIDGADGLPLGLGISNGVVTGTISTADCSIQNGTCPHAITVHAHFREDADAQGNIALRTDGAFTWLVDDGNATPTLDVTGQQTTWTVLRPLTITLTVFDQDANDAEILRLTGGPAGVDVTRRTGYGNQFAASITGTPAADPPYDHVYPAVVDLFDCNPAWADQFAAAATVADLQAALTAGNCFHHVTKPITVTITDILPVFGAAIADQYSNAGTAIAPLTVTATDADSHLPIAFTVTGLPAGLDYCHVDQTGVCPAVTADPHKPVASNLDPAKQAIRISGTPATAVNNQPVTVRIEDAARGGTQTSFRWTIHAAPVIAVADQFTPVTAFATYAINASSPNQYGLTFSFAGLPSWLAFNQATQTVSGTAPAAGSVNHITVTVQDQPPAGKPPLSTTVSFTWTVRKAPDLVVRNQTSLVNAALRYTLTPLANSEDGYPITLTATGLPAWLTFDPSAQTFAGTAPSTPASASITVTATDRPPAGQLALSTTAAFTWSAITNHPPVCSLATVTPQLLWPATHKLVSFSIGNVTDADNDPLTMTINRITQDQPPNGTGDGSTPFDATGVGTSVGAVRAERSGNLVVSDVGRMYQIDFTASDGKPGGTCSGTVFIGVPHDQGQHSLPVDNQCRWDSTTGAQLGSCPPTQKR